jgi:ADP-glucose pyrophosphorylase
MAALRGEFPLPFDGWSETDTEHKKQGSWVHQSASVEGSVKDSIVGEKAVVLEGTSLTECIVWDGVTVPSGSYTQCIFFDGGVLQLDNETK